MLVSTDPVAADVLGAKLLEEIELVKIGWTEETLI